MLRASPRKTIINPLPGGITARVLAGESPTVARLMRDETEGRDDLMDPALFRKLDGHPLVEYGWPGWKQQANLFPMVYTDVGHLAATYTIPVEQARALLPKTRRLTPMRLTPSKAVILFFAFDYRRGGLGRYHELGVGIPVLLDAPGAFPFIPALRDKLKPNSDPRLGMYAVELPVNAERACVAGIKLYGLPKRVGESKVMVGASGGEAHMDHAGKRMMGLRVSLPGSPAPKRYDLSFTTLSIVEGRIVRTVYDTVGEGYRGRKARRLSHRATTPTARATTGSSFPPAPSSCAPSRGSIGSSGDRRIWGRPEGGAIHGSSTPNGGSHGCTRDRPARRLSQTYRLR